MSDWIPRGALAFVDRPYTSDLFLAGAFRYPIGLPSEMLPEAWRDEGEFEDDDDE